MLLTKSLTLVWFLFILYIQILRSTIYTVLGLENAKRTKNFWFWRTTLEQRTVLLNSFERTLVLRGYWKYCPKNGNTALKFGPFFNFFYWKCRPNFPLKKKFKKIGHYFLSFRWIKKRNIFLPSIFFKILLPHSQLLLS